MASRNKASDQIREWLTARGITCVSESAYEQLATAFPALRSLRRAVRQCGIPMDPLVEGVRQDSFEELARSLVALQRAYEAGHQQRARALVIESKAHARFSAGKRPEKLEMVEWMLVWLDNPSLFETWVKLRLRAAQR